MYQNRNLIIASRHGKERVLAPILERELGVRCIIPDDFDTDVFGTFSGEKERLTDPLSTARQKSLEAMERYGVDLAIASEGSFGPHPTLVFVPADDEILFLMDKARNQEIWVREISTSTNFSSLVAQSLGELKDWAQKIGFPEHGIILRKSEKDTAGIQKGIRDYETLEEAYGLIEKNYGQVFAQTDMRAMHNPRRMAVIALAAGKLVEKIKSVCPACGAPGYGVTGVIRGLPCSGCGSPTRSVLHQVYGCTECGHEEMRPNPQLKTTEDPGYCDYCNP